MKNLICVDYPGVVVNVDKMIKTLGGRQTIYQTYKEPDARLELKFRPDDVYCHSVFGDRVQTTNLLVKFVRKKKVDADGKTSYECRSEIIGIVQTFYAFRSLADFQYLPMAKCDDGTGYRSIVKEIIPSNPFQSENITFNPDAPLFVLPTIFSRFDNPSDYFFRDEPKFRDQVMKKEIERQSRLSMIGRMRKPRSLVVCIINWFDTPPEQPSAEVMAALKKHQMNNGLLEIVTKLFDVRPIWSRNVLMCMANCARSDLRYILPCLAYYYSNGPYRCLWIKFGFDPRTDRSSKIYQTLDFRVKQVYAKSMSSDKIRAKRSIYQYQLPLKKNDLERNRNRYRALLLHPDALAPTSSGQGKEDNSKKSDVDKSATYIFRPGVMPSYRQVYYQLCDIEVPEVQRIIHANDGQERDVCDEKDGWCETGSIDKIRSVMSKIVDEMLSQSKGNNEGVLIDDIEEEDEEDGQDEYFDFI